MFQERFLSSENEPEYKVQSRPYQPFRLTDKENPLSKSVFEIESDMRMRNLNNISRFKHNQNYSRSIGQPQFYDRPAKKSVKDYRGDSEIVKKNLQVEKQQTKGLNGIKSQGEAEDQDSEVNKFSCKSCLLIVLSLVILAVMAGFLFLILTNQFEQVEYIVLTKLRLWKGIEPDIFYGSASGSHPVSTNQIPIINSQLLNQKPPLLLSKDNDENIQETKVSKITAANSVPPIQQPFSYGNYLDAIQVKRQSKDHHKRQNHHSLRRYAN